MRKYRPILAHWEAQREMQIRSVLELKKKKKLPHGFQTVPMNMDAIRTSLANANGG